MWYFAFIGATSSAAGNPSPAGRSAGVSIAVGKQAKRGTALGMRHAARARAAPAVLAGIALIRPTRRGGLSWDLPLYHLADKAWWWASASKWMFEVELLT